MVAIKIIDEPMKVVDYKGFFYVDRVDTEFRSDTMVVLSSRTGVTQEGRTM